MREIRFYRASSGHSPVEEFLDSLTGKQAQKVIWVLRLIEELKIVPSTYLKRLAGSENLWEVRAQHAGVSFRLIGFFDDADRLVLVGGFAKKTPRIPIREIAVAEQRRRDHLNRNRQQ